METGFRDKVSLVKVDDGVLATVQRYIVQANSSFQGRNKKTIITV